MDERIWSIGPDDGLRFEFRFDDVQSSSRHQAWGGGRLFFADELIWAGETEEDDEAPLYWSWFDLLEFLANHWPWLVLEQRYPIPVNPLYPIMMYEEAERRWQAFPESVVEEEDMLVYAFSMRHNLALSLKGVFVSCVMIMRRGNECLISIESPKMNFIRPFLETVSTLESVGNLLADVVGEESTGYPGEIVRKWRQRDRLINEVRFDILSGMDRDARMLLEAGTDSVQYWDVITDDSELLAVARMTSAVFSPSIQTALIEKIRSVRHHETDVLDHLAAKAAEVINPDARPYAQGYYLAEWLRDELNIKEMDLVDPECILSGWGVQICEIELPDSAIDLDAVAAWGPRHGPVIMLNCSSTARCSTSNGRRTTLAHEICHLLLDRENGLPMAEVLGGLTPESLEQRARAFAAEFLLPGRQAIAAMHGRGSVESILVALTEKYQVSKEVAAWQIVNSPDFPKLYKPDQAELKSIVSAFYSG
jgi:Zn-dependent peptidase ImmA (M78 family)